MVLAGRLLTADISYVDPHAVGAGRLDTAIRAVQQQFAGLTFRLAELADGHHSQLAAAWPIRRAILSEDGPVADIAGS